MRPRVNLLNIWVDRLTTREAGARIECFIRSGAPHQLIPANVDFLRIGHQNEAFRNLINTADMVVPDGMPLVWASRVRKQPLPNRISGVDLIHECARVAALHGYRIFLLGAAPGVAADAAAALELAHEGVKIAGVYVPPPLPLSPEEDARTVARIRAARPDILLVAFGAPMQEYWIRSHMQELGVPVCIGIGGAFDMLAGRVRRAPLWMQRSGFEWLFRLVQEPRRLWRRYFVHDLPVFIRLLLQAKSNSNAPPPASASLDPHPAFEASKRSNSLNSRSEEQHAPVA